MRWGSATSSYGFSCTRRMARDSEGEYARYHVEEFRWSGMRGDGKMHAKLMLFEEKWIAASLRINSHALLFPLLARC